MNTKRFILDRAIIANEVINQEIFEIEAVTKPMYNVEGMPRPIEQQDSNDAYVATYLLRESRIKLHVNQMILAEQLADIRQYEKNTPKWKKIIDILIGD